MSRTRLPNRRAAQIAMFEHDGRRYRATFGTFGNGALGEVFLDCGKANSTLQQHSDDAAVLVSLLLQAGISPTAIRHSISGPISVALDIWLAGSAP
jgi:ribonucleoside-diphosphate reductase alpha chain